MAAAPVQHRGLQLSEPAQIYTLKSGETVQDVAKKYGISLNELHRLNQLRSFAHGFDHLRAGDEIDVPACRPSTACAEGTRQEGRQTKEGSTTAALTSAQGEESVQEWQRKVADALSGVGTALSSRSKFQSEGDVFADMATGMAASQASAQIEDWMRGYANARIQLSPDRHLSLRNMQADLLFPLWETQSNLLFTQGSLHRSDGRLQSNLGLGWRHFAGTWMAGANTFFDEDYTGRHSRGGVGLEYWRNDLKLSTNAYFRLSGWKDARDLEDYEARPADGWDIRTEAWLPAYPQLGGKLTWEQYYGHEVGMSGASERFADPHRLTAGLSWTPVPLVTLTAERSLGGGGGNDARVGVEFRWQPGVPLSRQTDGSAVGYMRSLAGSRYDFVSRNNDIILEYRKKQVIFLSLPEQLSGRSGSTVSLHATVRSEHGFDHIAWQAGAFSAAGGKINDLGGGDFQLILPPYTSADGSQNTWTLSAVATDSKGNTSSPAQTRVTVIPGQLSVTRSTFIPTESSLPADGHTTQVLTLTLADESGQPVDLNADGITLHQELLSGSPLSATLSRLTRQAPGIYTLTVTAGRQSGSFRLTPVALSQTLPFATIHVAGKLAPGQSSVTATPDTLIANGREASVIRFVTRDAQGEPVTGLHNISFSLSAVAAPNIAADDPSRVYTLSPVVSEGGGVYSTILSGRQAGVVTLRPRVDGRPVGDLNVRVTFTSDATTGELMSFTRDRNEAKASGEDEVHLRASVRDARHNPVPGQTILFSATAGAHLSSDTVLTDSNGEAEVTLTSTNTGDSVVTASLHTSRLTQNVRFVADGNSAQIPEGYLVVLRDNVVADGLDAARVGMLVTDKQYNPLPGVTVKLSADNGAILGDESPRTDNNGEIYTTLQNTTAGLTNVTAEINGSRRIVPVHFIASHRAPVIVRVTALNDNVPADGRTPVRVQAVVTDANGNILPDVTVGFSATGDARLSASTGLTDKQGVAVVEVRSVTAGTFTLTAGINGNTMGTDVHFAPDRDSARIENGHLVVLVNNQPAGSSDRVGVLVTDSGRNPVPGMAVKLSADGGAVIAPADAVTDEHGEVYATVSSRRAGATRVTATLTNGSSDSAEVAFVPDTSSARVTALDIVSGNGAPADNHSSVTLRVTVQDSHNNPVANSHVTLSADAGVTLSAAGGEVTTDDQGQADFTVVSRKAGDFTVRAKGISGPEKAKGVHFIADLHSLKVNSLDVDRSQPADGASAVRLTAKVQDNLGNPAPDGVHVHFTLPADVVPQGGKPEAVTAGGSAVLKVVSVVDGVYTVKAGVKTAGDEASSTVTFLADVAHAGVTLTGAGIALVGKDVTLKATVKDTHHSPVAGMAVAFTVEKGTTMENGTARFAGKVKSVVITTNEQGKAEVVLTDTLSGDNTVTATLANGNAARMVVSFVKKAAADLVAPANVTMTYDADLAKSVATSDAITGGNAGGALTVTSASPDAVKAELTGDNKVKLTARSVPAEPVKITVSQAATADTAAPEPVSFTVTVKPGAGGNLKARLAAFAGDTKSVTMPAMHGGTVTYALTYQGTTGAALTGSDLRVLHPGIAVVTATESREGYQDIRTLITVTVAAKVSPALTAPGNVTMKYDADPLKSTVTTEAISGGNNGGVLSVIAEDNTGVAAELVDGNKVKLTARSVPAEPVSITVMQAATKDMAAPEPVSFTVTVKPGAGGNLKARLAAFAGDTKSVTMPAMHGGTVTYALTYQGTTGAALTGSDLRVLHPGIAVVTATESREGYQDIRTLITVTVAAKVSPALVAPGNVTMKYDADPLKSTVTTEAISGGNNGGVLSVIAEDNTGVAAELVDGNKVKLTARSVPAEPVSITVMQAATKDMAAPKPVSFTVKVNEGTLPELKPADVTVNVETSDESNAATNLKKKSGFVSGTRLTYTSDNETIAAVDADGKVTGKKAGTATITVSEELANYTKRDETFTVTVKDVVSVTLTNTETATASPGHSAWTSTPLTATVTVNGRPAPDDNVVFTSDPAIAIAESSHSTVRSFTSRSSNGKAVIHIESMTAGDFSLKARYRGTESSAVTVTFNKFKPTLRKPADITVAWPLAANINTPDGVGGAPGAGNFTVSSSDETVVKGAGISISNDGYVSIDKSKVLKAGTTKITVGTEATSDAVAADNVSFTVKVNEGTLPELKPADVTVNVETSDESNAATNLKKKSGFVSGTRLTYTSDNETIAAVDADGKVTGKKAGTATITVSEELANYTKRDETFTVTVKDVVSVTLTHTGTATASPGSSAWTSTPLTATVTVNGRPAPDDNVVFTSDPAIAIAASSHPTDRSFTSRSSNGKAVIYIESNTAGDFRLKARYRETESSAVTVRFNKFKPTLRKPDDITVAWPLAANISTPDGVGRAPGAGNFTVSSSDETVVNGADISINNDGYVSIDKSKVLKAGTTKITVGTEATSDAVAADNVSFSVTVNEGTLPGLRPADVTVNVGASDESNAATNLKKKSGFVSGTRLTYTSGNATIAAVDADGKVTGKKAGTATITVSEELANYTKRDETFTVTVKDVVSVTLKHTGTATASPGHSAWTSTQLTAMVTVNGRSAPDDNVVFTSDRAIATVESSHSTGSSFTSRSSDGKAVIHIESMTAGDFSLKASYRGIESSAVTVTFNKFKPTLRKPADITVAWPLAANINTPDGVGGAPGAGNFTVSSSDETVVSSADISINNDGYVSIDKSKVLKAGTTKITVGTEATSDAVAADNVSFKVKVNEGTLPELKPADVTVNVKTSDESNAATNLKKKSGFVSGTRLTYTSDDETIAAVDADGKVTGKKAGTATITVSEELANYTKRDETFTVTVKDVLISLRKPDGDGTPDDGEWVTLEAKVHNSDGHAMSGKHVEFHTYGGRPVTRNESSTTDDNGLATIEVQARAGNVYGIQASCDECSEWSDEVFVKANSKPKPEVSLSLDNANTAADGLNYQWRTVNIKVTNVTAGTKVTVNNKDRATTGPLSDLETDSDGSASFRVMAVVGERYRFTASVGSIESSELTVTLRPAKPEVSLSLDNDDTASAGLNYQWRTVNIKVTNVTAGTKVTVNNKDRATTGPLSDLETDSDGSASFRVMAVVGERYRFTASVGSIESSELTVTLRPGKKMNLPRPTLFKMDCTMGKDDSGEVHWREWGSLPGDDKSFIVFQQDNGKEFTYDVKKNATWNLYRENGWTYHVFYRYGTIDGPHIDGPRVRIRFTTNGWNCAVSGPEPE